MDLRDRERELWFDDEYVNKWLAGQPDRTAERTRQFAMIRSVIPRRSDEPFRYLDLGAGDGWMDEMLLSHFTQARAVLLDGSPGMVRHARERLAPFGDRVTVVEADLDSSGWTEAIGGPIDAAVSTIALHNLGEGMRIRRVYAEIFGLLTEGGCFFNLDYVLPAHPALRPLGLWADRDRDANWLRARYGGGGSPASIEEQLVWLRAAGYTAVDCLWKEFQMALFGGFKGRVVIPEFEGVNRGR